MDFDNSNPADIAALAVIVQTEVDQLLLNNPGMNKIILLAHMQDINIEFQLAELLENVDMIVAGGSNTRRFDDNDSIRPGDSASIRNSSPTPAARRQPWSIPMAVTNTSAGGRIQNASIFDENGDLIAELVKDGAIAGDPNETFRVITLDFLANGGAPIPSGPPTNRVDLIDLDNDGMDDEVFTGAATFEQDGSKQDALAEYLAANFSVTPFNQADTGPNLDERVQNLAFRADTVFDSVVPDTPAATLNDGLLTVTETNDNDLIVVSKFFNRIIVTAGFDVIGFFRSSRVDEFQLFGFGGNDVLIVSESIRQDATIDGSAGNDILIGGRGNDVCLLLTPADDLANGVIEEHDIHGQKTANPPPVRARLPFRCL